MSFELNGVTYETDEDGYLIETSAWNEDVAKKLALTEGITMTEERWQVIYILRDYYAKFQIAPMIRILAKTVGKKLGKDKGDNRYLYKLYPGGPAKQACKIAGLPRPTGCV